jgi:hypothetical protein
MAIIKTKKAELEVIRDGNGTHARVIVEHDEWPDRERASCSLDAAIGAALQEDAELARGYRNILRDVARRLYPVIRKVIDGYRGNEVCWYVVAFKLGVNGPTVTEERRFTRRDFRTWSPKPEDVEAERTAILRRLCEIGLAEAEYLHGDARGSFSGTVREALTSAEAGR